MANLPETPQWEEGIYQIEVSDPVLGGPDGISNRQGKQLASRTLYLKQQVEKGGSDLAKHIGLRTRILSTRRRPAQHLPEVRRHQHWLKRITAPNWPPRHTSSR